MDGTCAHDACIARQGETHATPYIPPDITVTVLAAKHGLGYGDRSEADLRPAARRHQIRALSRVAAGKRRDGEALWGYRQAGPSAMKAYGRSKLCNILFTRELARRLKRRPRLSDVHV
jgi:NAD(P)-dependent dehydrogenase (short-subunit alcohol dehydrogenase family)